MDQVYAVQSQCSKAAITQSCLISHSLLQFLVFALRNCTTLHQVMPFLKLINKLSANGYLTARRHSNCSTLLAFWSTSRTITFDTTTFACVHGNKVYQVVLARRRTCPSGLEGPRLVTVLVYDGACVYPEVFHRSHQHLRSSFHTRNFP